jgi:hypothetical protein
MLAESVTQFQAQAFKELLPSKGPVKTRVSMGNETPETEDQARRVEEFMNYQITTVMEEYTPEMDQLLFYLPLAGTAFKKVYYDPSKQRAVSTFVPVEDLVVPYTASDLETCERVTHVVKMTYNDVRHTTACRILSRHTTTTSRNKHRQRNHRQRRRTRRT